MRREIVCLLAVAALALVLAGCDTTGDDPGYIGVWEGSTVELPGPSFADVQITLEDDGTLESLMYDVGGSTLQDGSTRGTYSVANGVCYSVATLEYDTGAWIPAWSASAAAYTLSGDTLTIHQDFDGDGTSELDWVLTRQ